MKHALLASFVLLAGLAVAQAAPATSIRPGEVCNDTSGKPINAHGGGFMVQQGAYSWSRQVWLPIAFDANGKPVLEKRNEWRPGL